jgi:hypothetical protein
LLHNTADQNNGKCLSETYTNSHAKYEWQCRFGHQWKSKAYTVINGHWCPFCINRISKPEIQFRNAIQQVYAECVGNVRGILENKKMELDIYLPGLRKAIEFDGDYWHSRPESQKRDLHKDEQCRKANVSLLRIKSSEFKADPQATIARAISWLASEEAPNVSIA